MVEDTQTCTNSQGFNKFQQIFWPIHSYELKKFLPMSMLVFCILFVYAMVRNLKDTFIQHYAICGGIELMPILKLFFVMPAAFFAVILYTFCVNKFGSRKTFYIMVSLFIAFYTIFLLILLPNINRLQPGEETVIYLQELCPDFLYYTIPCLTNWCYTLFYSVSEIWSTIAFSSLFWQFANRITKEDEAKRFYPLYSLISSVGVMLSGGMLSAMSKASGAEFERNVRVLISLCILFAVATMVIFYYINAVIVPNPSLCDQSQLRLPSKKMQKKGKIDVFEGIKMLFTVPYIGLIAVMIMSYGIADNLIETVWKAQLKITFPNPNSYSAMMGIQTIIVGALTICITILSTYLLQKFSWKSCAFIAPFIMMTMGVPFFVLALYCNTGKMDFYGPIGITSAWIGLSVIALTRSTKYCMFDAIKNMAYRPLDVDTKTKGQAAVEVIGGRSGKAGASLITALLTNVISVGSKITAHLYTIIPIFIFTVVGWIASVMKLGPKYEQKSAEYARKSAEFKEK